MLPGLTWLTPFDTKSLCPHTRTAVFVPAGSCNTRLLPLSATNTFPLGSTLTSAGDEKLLGEACGNTLALAAVDVKSDCPRTFFAAPPIEVLVGNTRTRLSLATATYRFPLPSSDSPNGPASEEEVACDGVPRVAKLACPHTALAAGIVLLGLNGPANLSTRVLLKSET